MMNSMFYMESGCDATFSFVEIHDNAVSWMFDLDTIGFSLQNSVIANNTGSNMFNVQPKCK